MNGMVESNDHQYHIPMNVDPAPWRWIAFVYPSDSEQAPITYIGLTPQAVMDDVLFNYRRLKRKKYRVWELRQMRWKGATT